MATLRILSVVMFLIVHEKLPSSMSTMTCGPEKRCSTVEPSLMGFSNSMHKDPTVNSLRSSRFFASFSWRFLRCSSRFSWMRSWSLVTSTLAGLSVSGKSGSAGPVVVVPKWAFSAEYPCVGHLLDELDVLLGSAIFVSTFSETYTLVCSLSLHNSVSIKFIGFSCSDTSSLGTALLRSPNDEYCDCD